MKNRTRVLAFLLCVFVGTAAYGRVATNDVTINDAITTVEDDVDINANNNVNFTPDGDITTGGLDDSVNSTSTGNVTVSADVDGDFDGGITMEDGALVNAGAGTITFTAADDITLGGLRTNNGTVDAVQIFSSGGDVSDGGDTSTDIIANADGALVTIDATSGVGSDNDLEIQVNSIDVANSTVGNIGLIQEAAGGDINVINLGNLAAVGDISLIAEDGTITVVAAPTGTGIEAFAGTVTLDAQGAGNDVIVDNTITTDSGDVDVDSIDDVEVNAAITTSGGDVAVDAQDDVRFAEAGDITTTGGDVNVSADFDGDGNGAITMANGALVDAGAGTILFEASEDITLGGLLTNSPLESAVTVTTDGNVIDGGDTDIEISAASGNATINAGVDIGFVGGEDEFFKILRDDIDPIETFTAAIEATAGNAIALDEQNPASVITLSAQTVFLTSDGDRTFDDVTPGVTNLALLAGGTLTLPATLEVSGDLRVEGAVDIVTTAADGIIELTADGLLFVSGSTAVEVLETEVNDLDVNSAGNLTVNNTGDLQLIDLNCDHIAAQTTGDSSDVTIRVVGDLTVIDDVIAGDVGDNNSTGAVSLTSTGNTVVRDVVLADIGDITIEAGQNLTITTPDPSTVALPTSPPTTSTGIVTTVGGNISLDAGNEIFMEDNGTFDVQVIAGRVISEADAAGVDMPLLLNPSAPDTRLGGGADAGDPVGGTITLSAENNVTISSLQTTNNTVDAIQITSVSGEVIDGGDTSSDVIAKTDGASVTIDAAAGVGSSDELEVQVNAIDVRNSTVGDIGLIQEAAGGDISVVNLDNDAAAGDILLTAEDGTITVLSLGQGGTGIEAVAGTIMLDAQGAGNDVIVNNTITSVGGDVEIDAGNDVEINAAITTGGGDVEVVADLSNGSITLTAGAVVNAGDGAITFEAVDILLGSVAAGVDINVQAETSALLFDIDLQGGLVGEDINLMAESVTVNGLVSFASNSSLAGRIDINGDYSQNEAGELQIDLLGTGAGNFDQLTVTGKASLAGSLTLRDEQAIGQSIITAAEGIEGLFSSINGVVRDDGLGLAVTYDPQAVDVTLALLGDTNLDGQVDVLIDGFVLVANLNTDPGGIWSLADFNGDGITDIETDAQLLVDNLGRKFAFPLSPTTAFIVSSSSVPEPSATILLLLLSAIAFGRRIRLDSSSSFANA